MFAFGFVVAVSLASYLSFRLGLKKGAEPSIARQIDKITRTNRGAKPYSKPSGKTKPKVNDDAQAWRNENNH